MKALKAWILRYQLASLVLLTLLLAVVLPLSLDIFRLNLIGKYLTYAFVAIGLVMLWGYGGVLSLGQGVFFGLGGYAMAMFLKLEASDPEATKIQSTPGIPDFMDWNQITELPSFWVPFKSFPFALAAVIVVPTLLAWIVSFAMFKRRVGGVYFAIITQAVALILTVLIIGQQGYTGGVNGMTDLKTLLGWDTRTDSAKYILYYVCVGMLVLSIVVCRWIQTSKLGTLAAGHARQGRPRALLGLRRGRLPHLRLLPSGSVVRHWRSPVHAAGGFHVTQLRRHRAFDRDGDFRGGWRSHESGGRRVRHAARQRRENLLLGKLPGSLALLDGGPVHRRHHGLSHGTGRRLGRQDRALVEIAPCGSARLRSESPPTAYGDSEACDPLTIRDHRLPEGTSGQSI